MPYVPHIIAIGFAALSWAPMAQAPTPAPAFEVASVKPSPPPPPNPFGFPPIPTFRVEPGGRLTASQITLRELIRRAYDVPDFQIDGGPAWLATDRFEVMATVGAGATGGTTELRPMLRALLQQRFALRTHVERQERPVFELVMNGGDRRLGRQLRPSSARCADCAINYQMSGGTMTMTLRDKSIDELIRSLVTETRRPVVDKTGLTGTFDGELVFAPTALPGLPPPPSTSPDAVSLVTALQEQFGLRLQPARAAVDVLVVDAAQPPSAN